MKTKSICTVLVSLLAVMVMAAHCQDKVRTAFDESTIIMGKTLVKTWSSTKNFMESEEGSIAICDDIIDKYADPSYSDEEAKAKTLEECGARMEKLEKDFRDAYSAAASSLEALEHIVDMWESIDNKEKMSAIADALLALKDLIRVLESAKVPIPSYLTEATNYIEGLAHTLEDM